MAPTRQPAASQLGRRCPCGRVLDAAHWAELERVGTQDYDADPEDAEHPEAYTLEHRNCGGYTISVILEKEQP